MHTSFHCLLCLFPSFTIGHFLRLLCIGGLRFLFAKSAGGMLLFLFVCLTEKLSLYFSSTYFTKKKKVFVYPTLTIAKPNGALSLSTPYYLLILVEFSILEIPACGQPPLTSSHCSHGRNEAQAELEKNLEKAHTIHWVEHRVPNPQ